jgi:hypothetical protein
MQVQDERDEPPRMPVSIPWEDQVDETALEHDRVLDGSNLRDLDAVIGGQDRFGDCQHHQNYQQFFPYLHIVFPPVS